MFSTAVFVVYVDAAPLVLVVSATNFGVEKASVVVVDVAAIMAKTHAAATSDDDDDDDIVDMEIDTIIDWLIDWSDLSTEEISYCRYRSVYSVNISACE